MNEGSVRLLRATLQARGRADPSPECLDAETVAAWADDTLGRDERRAAEAHAADCGRCQALVAAMAQTAPPVPERSWWRAPAMGWLVPLTTAAAALLVWISLPGAPRGPSPQVVSNTSVQEPPPPPPAAFAGSPPDITPSGSGAAKVKSRGATKADRGGQRSATGGSSSAPAAAAKSLSSEGAGGPPLPATSMPPPATAVPPERQPADADRTAAGRMAAGGQRSAVAQLELAKAPALPLGARRLTTVIASTSPASQWRILANGAVQHSTDGGNSWEVQPTGAPVMLTAGASPAPSICWLVGPQGIVVLSTDGRSWRRIAFPVIADLISVRATDDKSATVNTSDGRAFSTTDGGETWTR